MNSADIQTIESSGLHKRTPYAIHPVMGTQFSIARFSGGIKFNGDSYFYNPQTDELIRDDVLKFLVKDKKRKTKTENQQELMP